MIRVGGPDWALSTVTLGGDIPDKFRAIAAAGFKHVELFYEDVLNSGMSPRAIVQMAGDHGLRIVTIFPLRDFQLAGTGELTHPSWGDAGRMFDSACELGAEMVVVCSNTRSDALSDPEAVAADMAALADRAAARGLNLGYEALSWGRHVRSLEQAAMVVRLANRPNLGLVLDNFHHAWMGGGLEVIRQLKSEDILLVQLSDVHMNRGMDALTLSRNFRCFPGQGNLPVRDFHDAVRDIGYQGYFTLEVFNPGLKARPADEIGRMAMESIAWLVASHGSARHAHD